MRHFTTTQGFTLLELMVALCIFTIIGTVSYCMLDGIFTAQSRIEDSSNRLRELQRWLMISNRDMMQMAPAVFPAPTDADPKAVEPALSYGAGPLRFAFTRRGWSNPLGYPRSELQRIEYMLKKKQVECDSFPMTPLEDGAGKEKKLLLSHVNTIDARFLDQDEQWQSGWMPPTEHPEKLPKAAELSIDIEGMGVIRQLFPIAGMADEKQAKP